MNKRTTIGSIDGGPLAPIWARRVLSTDTLSVSGDSVSAASGAGPIQNNR